MLRSRSVSMLDEGEPEKLVESRRTIDVGDAKDNEVYSGSEHC